MSARPSVPSVLVAAGLSAACVFGVLAPPAGAQTAPASLLAASSSAEVLTPPALRPGSASAARLATPAAGRALTSAPQAPRALDLQRVLDDAVARPVDALEQAPAGAQENLSRRTRSSRTLRLPNGMLRTQMTGGPMFVPKDGQLQPIDSSLVLLPDGSGWTNRTGAFTVRLPKTLADGEVSVGNGTATVAYRLTGAAASVGVVKGSTVTYPEVFPGVDAAFVVTETGVTKLLQLRNRAARSTFDFTVRTDGVSTVELPDGAVEFRAAGQSEPLLRMPAPFAEDGGDSLTGFGGAVRLDVSAVSAAGAGLRLTVDPGMAGRTEPQVAGARRPDAAIRHVQSGLPPHQRPLREQQLLPEQRAPDGRRAGRRGRRHPARGHAVRPEGDPR